MKQILDFYIAMDKRSLHFADGSVSSKSIILVWKYHVILIMKSVTDKSILTSGVILFQQRKVKPQMACQW